MSELKGMGERIAFYKQKCDFCHEYVSVPEGENLIRVTIPGEYVSSEGHRKYTIVSGDICDMCLVKLHRLITVGLTAEEIAWGGTVFKWDDEEDGG